MRSRIAAPSTYSALPVASREPMIELDLGFNFEDDRSSQGFGP